MNSLEPVGRPGCSNQCANVYCSKKLFMPDAGKFIQKLLGSIESEATTRTVNKGEFLLKEGETERWLYWVESGALRVFYLSDIEELTIRLGYTGSFINSLSSFIKETPSEFYVEAIRKTKLKLVSKKSLLDLAYRDMETLGQYTSLMELLVTQQIEREIDLLISSPAERLQRVLERSPNVFQEVPLKYIASYLRMTPETLSRIRGL
jgi:CRP-like cAMP-binding protein